MNLYEIEKLENEIEVIAKENDGEVPQSLMDALVAAEMNAVSGAEKLCKYIKHLEAFEIACKSEVDRINDLKSNASKRIESIKKNMTPFVKEKGRFDVGTFKLSTRKSERLETDPAYEFHKYIKTKIETSLDKAQMKKDLKAGKKIDGAELKEYDNLQIK